MALFERRNDCKSPYTNYVVLIAIAFTISIGICTYFIYNKYMNHVHELWLKKLLLNTIMSIQHQIININGKYQRDKH